MNKQFEKNQSHLKTFKRRIVLKIIIQQIETFSLPNFSTMRKSLDSIQLLTENFVVSLAVNFPATEMTVSKTSGKLKPHQPGSCDVICGLCHCDVTEKTGSCIDDWMDDDVIENGVTSQFNEQVGRLNKYAEVVPNDCGMMCYSCRNIFMENFN